MKYFACAIVLSVLTACNGVLDGMYDDVAGAQGRAGLVAVDASAWDKWQYIDLATGMVQAYDIPTAPAAEWGADSTGIYTYSYDVFGAGLTGGQRVAATPPYPTVQQPQPAAWDIAVHLCNVRTNGGQTIATTAQHVDATGLLALYANQQWTADEWNETDVWVNQRQMMARPRGIIGNQGIAVNAVLSSWLAMRMPPPPRYEYDHHVFLLRCRDGRTYALRLAETTDKFALHIEYKEIGD